MRMTWTRAVSMCFTAILAAVVSFTQTPAPRVTGTVKALTDHTITVTNATGQDVTVTLGDASKLMQVPPGSKDLKAATPAVAADIATGDKVLVTGTAGDEAMALHAVRVVLMKSADIAASHAAEEAAWQKGVGGLVKSVDAATNSITISSAAKSVTVQTTPATKFTRYSGDSVRFEDAVGSKFSEVRPGDQLRVRGAAGASGDSIQADAVITGTFRNFSGLISAIDSGSETVTLKDLSTKKTVVVKIGDHSDLRRLPAQAAARFAARAGGTPVGPAGTAPGSSGAGASGPGGNARAGMDLSQMLSRLPTETLGSLKVGDAVMIVATQGAAETAQPVAVTVLAGVEPILQASPKGEMTLMPWSVGGGGGVEAGGGQ